MPYRAQQLQFAIASMCEIIALASLAIVEGTRTMVAVFTKDDWAMVFGPNGVAFISVLACSVLWVTWHRSQATARKDAIAREERERKLAAEREERERQAAADREEREEERRKNEDEAKERRHKELVQANDKSAESLKALTVEAIKAQMIVAAEQKTHANNVQLLSINVHNLCELLKKSPCLATMKLRDGTDITMSTDSRL